MLKELLSILAIIITFVAFIPYIRSIKQHKTRPHVFSWLIWGATTFVVFLAQLSDKGGAGAWPIGVSGLITLYVAWLAYLKKSDNSITFVDWAFMLIAISALPFWYFTANPFWAVLILTTVDLSGFGPTLRKAWPAPFEENLMFYILMMIRNGLAIAALQHYSATTVLFPAMTALACLLFITLIGYRRKII